MKNGIREPRLGKKGRNTQSSSSKYEINDRICT